MGKVFRFIKSPLGLILVAVLLYLLYTRFYAAQMRPAVPSQKVMPTPGPIMSQDSREFA